MKFIDLYAGIGGFRYALEDLGHECIFSAEKNTHAAATYFKNHTTHNPVFDMDVIGRSSNEEIDKLIPDHDILCAGFPCQTFSIGGKQKGFQDARGTQFFNILKILEVKKPRYILLENVKNIISHDNGNTYRIIKTELHKLGYKIPSNPLVISPIDLGLVQRRERAIFFAEKNKPIVKIEKPNIKQTQFLEDIYDFGSEESTSYLLSDSDKNYVEAWEDFLLTIKEKPPIIWFDQMTNNEWDDNWQDWKKKYIIRMRMFYIKNKDKIDFWAKKWNIQSWSNVKYRRMEWTSGDLPLNFKNKIITIRQSGIRVAKPFYFPTLVASVETPIIFDEKLKNFRWMTIKEMGKLQSFPSNFAPNKIRKEAYKMFGNAVNVEVIKYVAERLLK